MMMRSRWNAVGVILLAALLSSPMWGSIPPQSGVNNFAPSGNYAQPGTINYIEGQAAIGGQALTEKSVGSAILGPGQSISTENGRVGVLLTPGVILRIGNNSTLQMVSPGLADTVMTLQKGRAIVEVDKIRPENNIRIGENGISTQLQKAGLYEFDANQGVIRVFDGKAVVQTPQKEIEVTRGYELALNADRKLKAQKFNKKEYTDDFYRWASLRSSYLAEANVDQARRYAAAPGFDAGNWYANGWYGDGWYWDPWFDAYTFIPGDGIFFDPFGWGFYSPWMAYGAPFYGFGYGYGYYHHFGPGYRPYFAAGHNPGYLGHAYNVRGGVGAFGAGRGVGGGGFRGVGSAGFAHAGGGGFHGGGFGGGGFHGGGFGGGHGGGGGHGR